jgi:hypothetical protein
VHPRAEFFIAIGFSDKGQRIFGVELNGLLEVFEGFAEALRREFAVVVATLQIVLIGDRVNCRGV